MWRVGDASLGEMRTFFYLRRAPPSPLRPRLDLQEAAAYSKRGRGTRDFTGKLKIKLICYSDQTVQGFSYGFPMSIFFLKKNLFKYELGKKPIRRAKSDIQNLLSSHVQCLLFRHLAETPISYF